MKYRWILYLHDPMGGFKVMRVTSLPAAKRELIAYGKATGFHQDLQVTGQYGCTGSLYPYTDEDWAEAEDFADAGCPFGYPSYLVENGPRGGVKVISA
jgi:hypothetical protein